MYECGGLGNNQCLTLMKPRLSRRYLKWKPMKINGAIVELAVASGQVHDVETCTSAELYNVGESTVQAVVAKLEDKGLKAISVVDCLSVGGGFDEWVDEVAKGMTAACLEAGVSLVGGEMAALPDLLRPGSLDVVVFGVGVHHED